MSHHRIDPKLKTRSLGRFSLTNRPYADPCADLIKVSIISNNPLNNRGFRCPAPAFIIGRQNLTARYIVYRIIIPNRC